MSEYGVGREQAGATGEPAPAGGFAVEPAELAEPLESLADPADEPEPVEEYADPQYADPQQWISGLIAALDRAEQGIGSGPRDVLMARIKLAQAYSELGDPVQAAPLAAANVAQARVLFPSSEGMLRQLREFRDAACEAAGWTAAMMRESDEDGGDALDGFGGYGGYGGFEKPSELVARPDSVANADPAEDFAARETTTPVPANADPAEEFAEDFAADFAAEYEPSGQEMPAQANQPAEAESVGAVIHEFVRRPQEPDALQWAAEVQAALTQPAELAIPAPVEPEYAEEVEAALGAADLADLSDLADLAAIEEIIRLRYELREAQRTVERLRHVNRKLREALEFDETP